MEGGRFEPHSGQNWKTRTVHLAVNGYPNIVGEALDGDMRGLGIPLHMSLAMRKPAFCICENKDADQLRGNRKADQRLCFRYTDSAIPLLSKSEI